MSQVCDFIEVARRGRRHENTVFISQHLASKDRKRQIPGQNVRNQSFLNDHQALLEDLEGFVDDTDADWALDVFQIRVQQKSPNSLMHQRTFCTTDEGWTGVVLEHTQVRDVLMISLGLDAIFAVRPQACDVNITWWGRHLWLRTLVIMQWPLLCRGKVRVL